MPPVELSAAFTERRGAATRRTASMEAKMADMVAGTGAGRRAYDRLLMTASIALLLLPAALMIDVLLI